MSLFPPPPDPTAPASWLLAHCDGGSRGNPGPAGFGAVITDSAGNTLAELSDFLGTRTNNFAEYAGLLAVLAWTLDHGYSRLRVISDSLLMVRQVQGRYKVNSPDLKPLWQQARERIARLDGFAIDHALRHKNRAADQLANAAMDRGTSSGLDRGKTHGTKTRPANDRPAPSPPRQAPRPTMLRGFTRDGAIHLLGSATLPEGIFVKIIPE